MRTSLTLVLAVAIGCASGQVSTTVPGAMGFRSDHSTIAADVLLPERDRTLYDIVNRTWPAMMRPAARGPSPAWGSREVVGVYADGVLLGGAETLRTIFASNVLQVRRLTQTEEFMRFGRSHPGGAVVLVWRYARR